MKKHYMGLDVLRGLGIFGVLILHTAFYYFDGIYDLDLNEPPLIITLIGFVLMFAGLFAMISGFVHTLQFYRKYKENGKTLKSLLKYSSFAGLYILLIAYVYFLFTGPGLIHFETRSMDQSLFVELIKTGRFIWPSIDRILYIDSLVMIGLNVILLGLLVALGLKVIKSDQKRSLYFFILAVAVLALSTVRIPLYTSYLDARDNGQYGLVLVMNFFINKNNPILPFLSFGLFGSWIATLVIENNKKKTKRLVLSSGILFFVMGLAIYLTAEETMLDRLIDYTWYGIMVFQIGLFQLLIYLFLWIYDRKETSKLNVVSKFLYRFGVAGLTVFFIEQLFSAALKQIMMLFDRTLYLGLYASVICGVVIAIFWGFMLMLWQKAHYKYGIEYGYVTLMKHFGGSQKEDKLKA